MSAVIIEEKREIPVYDEADILIVGAGAAGHSAAVAAARAGAKRIVMIERYGFMGGLVTGGYVLQIPALTWRKKSYVRGLQEEWITRLEKIPGATLGPSLDEAGSEEPIFLQRWLGHNGTISPLRDVPYRVVRSVNLEPNQLKIEMDKMIKEQGDRITVYLHCWGTRPIMDGNTIKGVTFESKEGRKAVLAKVVIDATGDGDIYSQTGAPYFDSRDSSSRVSKTALVYRVGGTDFNIFRKWRKEHPDQFSSLIGQGRKIAGFVVLPLPTSRDGIVWFNNFLINMNCIDIKDLTSTEFRVRDTIRDIIEFYKRNVPGFENAFLYDIAPQQGTRCSRRLNGEYVMTPDDFKNVRHFDDVIAWHSTICELNDMAPIEIPYRVILPQVVENLLAPGRHLSTDETAIDWLNLIPQCVGTGQAAGVAATVAVLDDVTVRNVDIKKVQSILMDQDVPLPRQKGLDQSLVDNVVENNYGLYIQENKVSGEGESTHFKSFFD